MCGGNAGDEASEATPAASRDEVAATAAAAAAVVASKTSPGVREEMSPEDG